MTTPIKSAVDAYLKAVESYKMNAYKQIRPEQLENVTSHIQRGLDSANTYFKSSVDAITLYYSHQPTNFMQTIMDYRYVCFCADLVDEL